MLASHRLLRLCLSRQVGSGGHRKAFTPKSPTSRLSRLTQRQQGAQQSFRRPLCHGSLVREAEQTGSVEQLLETEGFLPGTFRTGENRLLCPRCRGGSSGEYSLSLRVSHDRAWALWNCFRATCGWRGHKGAPPPRDAVQMEPRVGSSEVGRWGPSGANRAEGNSVRSSSSRVEEAPPLPLDCLSQPDDEVLRWFRSRGISERTVSRNRVAQTMIFSPHHRCKVKAIAFAYSAAFGDAVVNIKYRTMDKRFWQVRGAPKVLYGLGDIRDARSIVIVEGEMDKLSVDEAGIKGCVSVPDGAPSQPTPPHRVIDPSQDKGYRYLWNSRDILDKVQHIVVATDSDGPGRALCDDLIRRLGAERCRRLEWPRAKDGHQYKDANEVLVAEGSTVLRECITETFRTFPDYAKHLTLRRRPTRPASNIVTPSRR